MRIKRGDAVGNLTHWHSNMETCESAGHSEGQTQRRHTLPALRW